MPSYVMVIDQKLCTGCGGCIIGCKNENNLPEGVRWSNKLTETTGKFPNVRYHYRPTLCNQCENAPCVRGCPTKALYKSTGGITAHNPDKCIGCRYCMLNCPYGAVNYTWNRPHKEWQNNKEIIKGSTYSPKKFLKAIDAKGWPIFNPDPGVNYKAIRPTGVVEKCHFCRHRVEAGLLPYCVEVCPCDARIFGDKDDPKSKVSELLGKFKGEQLRPELGTKPRVLYIRDFNASAYEYEKGSV